MCQIVASSRPSRLADCSISTPIAATEFSASAVKSSQSSTASARADDGAWRGQWMTTKLPLPTPRLLSYIQELARACHVADVSRGKGRAIRGQAASGTYVGYDGLRHPCP
jgi:hypothetical protein